MWVWLRVQLSIRSGGCSQKRVAFSKPGPSSPILSSSPTNQGRHQLLKHLFGYLLQHIVPKYKRKEKKEGVEKHCCLQPLIINKIKTGQRQDISLSPSGRNELCSVPPAATGAIRWDQQPEHLPCSGPARCLQWMQTPSVCCALRGRAGSCGDAGGS